MKIAYLSTFYPLRGGIAQFNARLLKALSKFGEVRAFTFKRQYPSLLFPGKSQYVQPEDKAEFVNSLPILDTINPFSFYITARKIKEFQPNIVITKYWMPFFAPSLGSVLKLLKPFAFNIAILDNVDPHEKFPFAKPLNKFFLNQNHTFVVMSNNVLHDLVHLIPDADFVQVPHPLYDNFGEKIEKHKALEVLGLPFDKKILLFFGFIREYKGLDILLESISLLPDDYFLVVAGESYISFDKYYDLIDKLKIKDKVKLFVRYISDTEVPIFFSASDVCVLPYKSATQSGIVGIAYHFDTPVIATRVGGLPEMIENYGSGIIVEKVDAKALAEGISTFFHQNSEKFVDGIKRYKSIASWDYLASRIIKCYSYFLAKK